MLFGKIALCCVADIMQCAVAFALCLGYPLFSGRHFAGKLSGSGAHAFGEVGLLLRQKLISIRISRIVLFLTEGREGFQLLNGAPRILTYVCCNSLGAVSVMHHKVNVRCSLIGCPTFICVFGIKLNTGNRRETVPLIGANQFLAVAVQLCAARCKRLRNNSVHSMSCFV